MRILHCLLILAFAILLKNVYCDSSNPLPNSTLTYYSSLPKPKASTFELPATNTKLDGVSRPRPPPPRRPPPPPRPPPPRSPPPRPPPPRPPPPRSPPPRPPPPRSPPPRPPPPRSPPPRPPAPRSPPPRPPPPRSPPPRPPPPRSPPPRPPPPRSPPPRPPPPPTPRPPPPRSPPPPSIVTTYILGVIWPPGACNGNSFIHCRIDPVPTEFKIRGLWPLPYGVPSTEDFDGYQIANITPELEEYWPNLEDDQEQIITNNMFWEREWNWHGRYSEMGVLEYFEKALELYRDVGEGLKEALDAEGINPTIFKIYKLQDIEAALERIYGFSCTVICNLRYYSPWEQIHEIQEIRFSFTEDFELQNNVDSSACGTDVMFPELGLVMSS